MKKRRSFSNEFKARVVLEVLSGQRSKADACRHYQIKDSLLTRWTKQFLGSSVYAKRAQQARRPNAEEQGLKAKLEDLAVEWPCFGYRRMTKQLRRQGHQVGRKRVRRLMDEMGLLGRKPTRKVRTIKEEEVDLSDYEDLFDARCQIGHFLDEVYQHKRIHSSLGYLPPSEFEAAYFKEQSEAEHPP